MKGLLLCVIVTGKLVQILAQNSTAAAGALRTTESPIDPYNRTQYCHWPCACPLSPPDCPPGVSLVTDGCDCCRTCAKQLGESCTEADTCDPHRELYCDYSKDRPRYEVGLCAHLVGVGCELNGRRFANGQNFQPNCKYKCTCVNGAIGCVPACRQSRPPLVWCQHPKSVRLLGRCCEQWICDQSKRLRKPAPRHVSMSAYGGDSEVWRKNCLVQTTGWSACSKTCGMGISTRVSNDNQHCHLGKERRLCLLRPCDVDITEHIKPGKRCLSVLKQTEPLHYTLSGCVSRRSYRPKYCGGCTDERCCGPLRTRTIPVTFTCPDGTSFSKDLMWINSCFCNLGCQNPNDIFTDLSYYPSYSEVSN
ncbi:CCN family member 4-like [Callorhinchus milii]|nr:CCN family member 4-like [Callorhinchus milii]XP_042187972.1 CCN family member 4-like [Callorhinchus milii]